jgi:rSAM/selenodomain-associated transferase 2
MPDHPPPTISVIIPTLNEALHLSRTLASVQAAQATEVIVVDGGSQDRTVAIAQAAGVQVLVSPPGRAQQMNQGAQAATAEILLFLHADTCLPPGFEHRVQATLHDPRVIAGAFELQIESDQPGISWVEWGVKLRSRLLHLPYGDQAIFLRQATFAALQGWPDMPIMEDVVLVRRLAQRGLIAIVPAAVTTSGRRWQRLGILRTTLINQLILLGFYAGIPPQTLKSWYRQQR